MEIEMQRWEQSALRLLLEVATEHSALRLLLEVATIVQMRERQRGGENKIESLLRPFRDKDSTECAVPVPEPTPQIDAGEMSLRYVRLTLARSLLADASAPNVYRLAPIFTGPDIEALADICRFYLENSGGGEP